MKKANIPQEKYCLSCRRTLPISEFYVYQDPRPTAKGVNQDYWTVSKHCKSCISVQKKQRYQEDPDYRERCKKYRARSHRRAPEERRAINDRAYRKYRKKKGEAVKQYRVFAWPRQVDLYGKYKPEQYNPQYWDEREEQWRPFTVEEDGIIRPKLYDSRLEARQFIKIMEMKGKK